LADRHTTAPTAAEPAVVAPRTCSCCGPTQLLSSATWSPTPTGATASEGKPGRRLEAAHSVPALCRPLGTATPLPWAATAPFRTPRDSSVDIHCRVEAQGLQVRGA